MPTSRLDTLAKQLAADGRFSRVDAREVAKQALSDRKVTTTERANLERIAQRYQDQFDTGGSRALREFTQDPSNHLPSAMEVLHTVPFEEDTVADRFVDIVGRAQESIDGAFFQVLQPDIVDALADASERGVKVRLVTDDNYFDAQDNQEAIDYRVKVKQEANDIHIALKRVVLGKPGAELTLTALKERLDALEQELPNVPYKDAHKIDLGPARAYVDAMLRGEQPDKTALAGEQRELSNELSDDKVLQKYRPAYDKLLAAGVQVRDDDSSELSHNKYMVLDQEVVWAGSYNLQGLTSVREPTQGLPMTADNVVILESKDLAQKFQTDFDQMLAGKFHSHKEALVNGQTVDVDGIPVTPYFSPDRTVPERLAEALEGYLAQVLEEKARGELKTPPTVRLAGFTFSHAGMERVVDALIRLKGAGADVRVLLNSNTARARYSAYHPLTAAGVPVDVAHQSTMMHNKFLSVEDSGRGFVWTGSANFTGPAYQDNDESVLLIQSADVARQYEEIFEALQEHLEPKVG